MKNWPSVRETPLPPVRTVTRQRGGRAVVTAFAVTLGLLMLASFSGTHVIFAIVAIPVVVSLAWSNPEAMIAMLPVWMVLMGLVRRLTPGGGNVTFSGDPVLLVGPAALLVMWLMITAAREPGRLSPLARAVFAFNVVAIIEAFNPSQGTLLTGIGGLLFILIPTTAFWIGRRYADPLFVQRIIWTVAIMALIAAAYGLYQQFIGFPSWDSTWIHTRGYTALNVGGGVIRAFSSFSSGQEYAVFLSVGTVAWTALASKATRWPLPLHVAALSTVVIALFYESQRTSFFLTVLAMGVMGASRLRMRPINVLLAGVVSMVLLITFAGALSGGGGGSNALSGTASSATVLKNHQLSGLTNPTGPGSSLNGHIKATRIGIKAGFSSPLGHGTGSVNLAASRYTAKNKLHGSEFDPGNMGIAFGIPGMVVYCILVWSALQTAYRLAVRRRDAIGLFVIGVLAATLFQWTNGDLYSVCWLIWLSLGFADHLLANPSEGETTTEPDPQESPWTWRRPGEPRRSTAVR